MPTEKGPIHLSRRLTGRIKAQYEDWLEARSRRRVFDLRKELTPQEFKESMRAVTEASAAYALAWGGDACLASINQMPGIIKMISLLAAASGQQPARDEEFILDVMVGNEQDRDSLTEAFKNILDSSPNFLLPPSTADRKALSQTG